MIDILTKLSMAIGRSQEDNNELYESEKPWGDKSNWKYDVVLTYVAANFSKRDLLSKCVKLSKELKLGEINKDYELESYWKDVITSLKEGTKKEQQKEAEKVVKKITSHTSNYGCGSSHSYGCGSSRSSSYGCGSSRGYNYGC